MRHGFFLNDEEFDVALSRRPGGYRLHLADSTLDFDLHPAEAGDHLLLSHDQALPVKVAVDGDWIHIHLDGETYALRFEHALQRLAEINDAGAADQIRASMPGSVVALEVNPGDKVSKGQTLLVMESMKMETTIIAPRDGIVADIQVAAGQTFDKDAVLLALEPEGE